MKRMIWLLVVFLLPLGCGNKAEQERRKQQAQENKKKAKLEKQRRAKEHRERI